MTSSTRRPGGATSRDIAGHLAGRVAAFRRRRRHAQLLGGGQRPTVTARSQSEALSAGASAAA